MTALPRLHQRAVPHDTSFQYMQVCWHGPEMHAVQGARVTRRCQNVPVLMVGGLRGTARRTVVFVTLEVPGIT